MSASVSAEELIEAAKAAAKYSYSPYSQFPVGAALIGDSGTLYKGCNVENISYGLTLCAEQTAIAKAVSSGEQSFSALAIWGSQTPNGSITPCGACRQILAEFFSEDTKIYMTNSSDGSIVEKTISELIPDTFNSLHSS